MSVEAIGWAWKQETGSPTLKAVLLAIANYADEHWNAWPSQVRLAKITELSERSIVRAIQDLEERGFLSVERRSTPGGRMTNVLHLIEQGARESLRAKVTACHLPKVTESHLPNVTACPKVPDRLSPKPIYEPVLEEEERKEETREGALAFPPDAFDQFWHVYPNKVGKPVAKKSFEKIQKIPDLNFAEVMDGLRAYIGKTDDRPWCNPATWLNQHRWADRPATVEQADGRRFGNGTLAAAHRFYRALGEGESSVAELPRPDSIGARDPNAGVVSGFIRRKP